VVLLPAIAAAQQPTRLPAVVSVATPDPPGPRKIAGIVRDTGAVPVEKVEITIPALSRRAFSGADGTFRFEDIKPGTYDLRARKVGFAPQVRPVVVDTAGGVIGFSLVPFLRVLEPVVSSASRGGLSGIVGDTAFNAIPGAEVRVVGHGQQASTDATGAFYIPLQPGSYVVSIQQSGFDYKLVSVIIPPDSGRRITVFLPALTGPRPVREAHNIEDFEQRLSWRSMKDSRVFTRAELQKDGFEWVFDAVKMAFGSLCNGGRRSCDEDRDCSVVVNGGPRTAKINTLTVDEIETVEVYYRGGMSGPPPARGRGADARPSLRAPAPPVPLSNLNELSYANATRNCIIAYVWMR
jgi:hypothetical protein